MNKNFVERLENALDSYWDSIELIDSLLEQRQNAQEIILLACARLDSLANLINKNKSFSQKQTFIQILSNYSGEKKFFNSISVGELYRYLYFYSKIAEDIIVEKPGGIRNFGRDSENFLDFIEKSDIPVTGKRVRQLAQRLTKILEKNFRVKLGQRLDKNYITTINNLKKIIYKEFKSPEPKLVYKALESMIDSAKISSIFYEDFRCQVIHGFIVPIEEDKFFTSEKPYHSIDYSLFGKIFSIEFSGKYLRNLLNKVLNTFTFQIKNKKKVPFDLINVMYNLEEMFEGKDADYIDDDEFEGFEDVKWLIKKR